MPNLLGGLMNGWRGACPGFSEAELAQHLFPLPVDDGARPCDAFCVAHGADPSDDPVVVSVLVQRALCELYQRGFVVCRDGAGRLYSTDNALRGLLGDGFPGFVHGVLEGWGVRPDVYAGLAAGRDCDADGTESLRMRIATLSRLLTLALLPSADPHRLDGTPAGSGAEAAYTVLGWSLSAPVADVDGPGDVRFDHRTPLSCLARQWLESVGGPSQGICNHLMPFSDREVLPDPEHPDRLPGRSGPQYSRYWGFPPEETTRRFLELHHLPYARGDDARNASTVKGNMDRLMMDLVQTEHVPFFRPGRSGARIMMCGNRLLALVAGDGFPAFVEGTADAFCDCFGRDDDVTDSIRRDVKVLTNREDLASGYEKANRHADPWDWYAARVRTFSYLACIAVCGERGTGGVGRLDEVSTPVPSGVKPGSMCLVSRLCLTEVSDRPVPHRFRLAYDAATRVLTVDGKPAGCERSALLGRGEGCDIRLPGYDFLSRRHATIYHEGHAWWIREAGRPSTNGTAVRRTDGTQTPVRGDPVKLESDDVIHAVLLPRGGGPLGEGMLKLHVEIDRP